MEEEIVVEAAAPDTGCEFDEDEHPWPYLREMFSYAGTKESSYRMKCLLCLPKDTEILAFKNSPSNLKEHIEVSYSCEFTALVLLSTLSQFTYNPHRQLIVSVLKYLKY